MTDGNGRARWRRAYDHAARAEATLGEICEALRSVWGSYTESPAF